MEHDWREAESGRVLEFLSEVSGRPFNHDQPNYYGRPKWLDEDTAKLCEWCAANDVSKMSLELQLWWQQHQKRDAKRQAEEAEAAALTERAERNRLAELKKKYPD